VSERGVKPLSLKYFPLSFKERGIKGVRLINTFLCWHVRRLMRA
jgi:hypothetical protein